MTVQKEESVVVGIVLVGFVMLIALIAMQGCSYLTRIDNPVQPGYPCGTRGIVCSESPLSCCWSGDICGAKGTSCPEDACCYVGDGTWSASGEQRKQWQPQ